MRGRTYPQQRAQGVLQLRATACDGLLPRWPVKIVDPQDPALSPPLPAEVRDRVHGAGDWCVYWYAAQDVDGEYSWEPEQNFLGGALAGCTVRVRDRKGGRWAGGQDERNSVCTSTSYLILKRGWCSVCGRCQVDMQALP